MTIKKKLESNKEFSRLHISWSHTHTHTTRRLYPSVSTFLFFHSKTFWYELKIISTFSLRHAYLCWHPVLSHACWLCRWERKFAKRRSRSDTSSFALERVDWGQWGSNTFSSIYTILVFRPIAHYLAALGEYLR